mgnify:CR=1 FL=1
MWNPRTRMPIEKRTRFYQKLDQNWTYISRSISQLFLLLGVLPSKREAEIIKHQLKSYEKQSKTAFNFWSRVGPTFAGSWVYVGALLWAQLSTQTPLKTLKNLWFFNVFWYPAHLPICSKNLPKKPPKPPKNEPNIAILAPTWPMLGATCHRQGGYKAVLPENCRVVWYTARGPGRCASVPSVAVWPSKS